MAKKSSSKEKTITLRTTVDFSERIKAAADVETDGNVSEWILRACEQQLSHGVIGDATRSDRKILADLLLYDEGIMDIIYQKIAEKLRLSDILSEIDDFAAHGCSSENTELHLREFAAKLHYLVEKPYHEGEIISGNWVNCNLNWEADWTLDEYLQMDAKVLSRYRIFHIECRDRENSDRGNGFYFWDIGEENGFLTTHDLKNFFDEGESVHVLAGNITADDQESLKIIGSDGGIRRIVEIVRYVCRDNNLGDTGELLDWNDRKKLKEQVNTAYFVRQTGMYALGIPYEFHFGWVSDDSSSGKYENEAGTENELSYRPEIDIRWHYTHFEELDTGETPFTRQAVPETVRYGRYLDEAGKKQCHVPVVFDAVEDNLRKDRKGYPKTGKKEVKR